MAFLNDRDTPTIKNKIDTIGNLWVGLKDSLGLSITKKHREVIGSDTEYLPIAGKNDDYITAIRTDRKGGVMMGNYTPELIDSFEGATLNATKWNTSVSGFAHLQQTATGYNLTSTTVTTVSAYSILTSQRIFQNILRVPVQAKSRKRINMVSNTVADFGFGTPATTAVPVVGACLRFVGGNVYATLYANSVAIVDTAMLASSTIGGNIIGNQLNVNSLTNYYTYDIIFDDDNILFTVQDTETGDSMGIAELTVPKNYYKMFSATSLTYYERINNTLAVPATAPTYILSAIQILSLDANWGRNNSDLAGSLGLSCDRNPFTGVQTANHVNSTAPTSATLSNTAAGYATLGGQFQFVAVVGAATDYALFGFTVPAGSRLGIEGVTIELWNTVVPVAATATSFQWFLASNGSAVSLATANFVREEIGYQYLPVGATVGQSAQRIDINFSTPQYTESGRFVVIGLNIPIGTATATEIFRGIVTVKGKFF